MNITVPDTYPELYVQLFIGLTGAAVMIAALFISPAIVAWWQGNDHSLRALRIHIARELAGMHDAPDLADSALQAQRTQTPIQDAALDEAIMADRWTQYGEAIKYERSREEAIEHLTGVESRKLSPGAK